MSCQKEVLAPEQMIQGKFALDDGTALTSSYLVFDKGHLSTYISESDRPFAEGKIWRVDGDLFTLSSTVSYSITDGVLNTSSTSAPIELKDGILTIGETKYSLLEGLEHEPYSTIVTDREQVFSYTVQDITIPFTVDRPLPNSNLSCSTNTSWITGLAIQEGVIIAHLSSTSTDRDGAISLSYPFAEPVVVSIKRRPSTFICLEEDSRTVDYTAQRVVLPYTIDNPISGSSLTTSVDASWINNIQVSDNEVSFNVTENNSVGSRSAAVTLHYKGAPDVTFHITQEYSAPVITLTPSSQTVNYAGGTFSFDYTITNPREGITVTAVSQATWITDVTVSGTTVSYKVAENNSGRARTGTIKLTYGTSNLATAGTSNLATASFTVTQTYEAPIIELTPTSNEVDYTGGTFSFDYSIVNPREGAAVTISTIPSWISDVNISGSTVAYKVAENNSGGKRTGAIKLTYSGLVTTSFNVTQTYAAPTIVLMTNTIELDYTGGTFSFNYSITNPREDMTVTASVYSGGNWISDLVVYGETISYKIDENNSGSSRTGKIKLTYGNLSTIYFTVTQTYSAPSIILTSSSIEVDYDGGTFSFSYSVTNPRAGMTITFDVIYDDGNINWITDVDITENAVKYLISENIYYRLRTGRITLNYMNATAEYTIMQVNNSEIPLPEGAVDLGLSVLWASCNLGASSPAEYGDYYAWGETVPYYTSQNPLTWKSGKSSGYTWESYSLCNGSSSTLTKYNNKSAYGTVDNKTTFKDYNYVDDAARVEWGNIWRMPTQEEFSELINNCTSEWTTLNGVYGRKFTSKKAGYTNRWIFLPAAGHRSRTLLIGSSTGRYWSSSGRYWSSSLDISNPDHAFKLDFDSSSVSMSGSYYPYRYFGYSVRPVL